MQLRFLPRTVVVLGFVSLLNDASSEMITPLLPVFLTAVLGAGPVIVGLVEGVAEATASLLKLIAGRMADRGWNPKVLVMAGYGTSNVMRPLIGLIFNWWWVLALRFLDRVGKGIRTAPRDALIAGATDSARRGAAFGFHRSMDHAGAVIGPLLAYALLSASVPLQQVFYWSIVPGALVLLLLLFGVQNNAPAKIAAAREPLHWKLLDVRLRAVIVVAAGLAFAAVPEVFVVLWAKDAGLKIAWIPLLWATASLAKMLIALPAGMLSDRIGRIPVLVIGWACRVAALLLLAFADAAGATVWLLFLAYSASLAMTEPAERSVIGDYAPVNLRGTAFGLYHLASGVLVLPGAIMFGAIWQSFSSAYAFVTAAVITACAALALLLIARRKVAATH
jgi:MFS family permease